MTCCVVSVLGDCFMGPTLQTHLQNAENIHGIRLFKANLKLVLKTNRIMGLSAALREGKIWDDSHLRMWQLFWVAILGISLTMKKRPQQMTNAITIMTTIFRILWFFSRQTARACFDFKSFNSDLCLKLRILREYKTMIAIRGRMKRNTKPPPRKIRESLALLIAKEQNVSFPSTTI